MSMKWGLADLTSVDSWRLAAVEMLATALFVFLGTGAAMASGGDITATALGHGLAIIALVAATAKITGAHINPAVTITMWALGKDNLGKSLTYIIGQLVGAVVGAYLLYSIVGEVSGEHALGKDITAIDGFLTEVIVTFALILTVLAVAVHPQGKSWVTPSTAAVAIGLVVLVDHLVAIPLTGASMNPARTFGPALVAGDFANHWVYWAGPIVGGLVAAGAYRYLMLSKDERAAE
ncbi:MAG: aquaporin [SAR202 cluster bacterium]|nr:aquaporin [SAR202 cluster bacterium]